MYEHVELERGGLADWIVQRFFSRLRRQGRAARLLSSVERLSLGERRELVLIACGSQRYLVGLGGNSVQCIVKVEQDVASHGAFEMSVVQ